MLSLIALFLSGPAAAAGRRNLIKALMLNTGVDPDAQGKVMVVVNKAQTMVKIKVSGLAPGSYDLIVDGALHASAIAVNDDGDGKAMYRSRNKGSRAMTPLAVDPRGAVVEVVAPGGPVLLTADVPSTPDESAQPLEVEVDLTNSGVQPGANAEAEYESKYGRIQFGVEVEGMIPGTYDLFVDGSDLGDIVVGADGEGEIEFDSRPSTDDDGDHDGDMPGDDDGDDDDHDDLDLLLTVDPLGKSIEIREQGTGVVLFSGIL